MMTNQNHYTKLTTTVGQQQGVALLVVLLLVVSITIVAGSMVASQKMTIRKSALVFEQNSINNTLAIGKYTALALIRSDSKLNDFDSDQDVWAKQLPAQETEDGFTIGIDIYDASAKLNINNLYHNGKVNEQYFAAFERLLTALNLDASLAKAVLDWQDPDAEVYEDGGDETAVYQSNTGQTPANQPFISVNQLLDVPNITTDTLDALKPYITAVPYVLPVNANTAGEQVLSAILFEQSADVQTVIGQQGSLTKKEALNKLELLSQLEDEDQKNKALDMLDVSSQAFEVVISVSNVDDSKHRYATMMVAKINDNHSDNKIDNKTDRQTANNGTSGNATNTTKNLISAYNYRIWAFKPNLAYNR